MREDLVAIVEEEDLQSLEAFCLRRSYRQVIEHAKRVGVDLDALEELLQKIS